MTAGAKAAADVTALLRARNPLLWISTREEGRAERLIAEACASASYPARFWDCATGVSDITGQPVGPGETCTDPAEVLRFIRGARERGVWILRDLPPWLRDPGVMRSLRSLSRGLALSPREQARAIVVLTPETKIPDELSGHAIAIEWPLPDREEIGRILDARINSVPEVDAEGKPFRATIAPNGVRDSAIDAAVGLTEAEADSCYAKSLVQLRRIDPVTVAQEKKRVIAREKVLEWYDPIPGGLEAVGGLDLLKGWLSTRKSAFSPKARAYGLPAPKGVLMLGPPGCGKSFTAKAIATGWGMPLLRFDIGALLSKWVGESGSNVRRALKVAETMAPCVLWIDEIEKGMPTGGAGGADGGVGSDILGAFLSWMQERQGSVFVVATSNDVRALPPELLRKGRFDEIFWIDLPTYTERIEIVKAALRSNGRAPIEGVEQVAIVTEGFTGAEISALIPNAMYRAFADGERPISIDDLVRCADATVPLSKTSKEKIATLREWAKDRTRMATSPEKIAIGQPGGLDLLG
jgi:MoxR-like ATPase